MIRADSDVCDITWAIAYEMRLSHEWRGGSTWEDSLCRLCGDDSRDVARYCPEVRRARNDDDDDSD